MTALRCVLAQARQQWAPMTVDPERHSMEVTPEPVFLVAPPCTFSWVVCAMVGQHPEAYALPELHLFQVETVREWWDACQRQSFGMDHGLLRSVAELYFGGQTEHAVDQARGWLRRRAHLTTGRLLEELIERLSPLVVVEKSPSLAHGPSGLRRVLAMFPRARLVHLVSHPR